jgi:multiple sugar transport system substrate-binding protein
MKDSPAPQERTSEDKRTLSRTDLIKSAGGVAAALAVGGGPLARTALGARRSGGSITMWVITPFTSQANPPLMKAVEKYQKATGVTVNVQSFTNTTLQNTLITAVKGGGGPDVVSIDGGWVPALAAAGVLSDLTTQFRPIKNQFFTLPIVTGQFQGKQWAVPWYTNNVALFYNKDLFKAGGIAAPPTTWAQLASTAQKLTNNGQYGLMFGGSGYGSFLWLPVAWQNGTNFFTPDGKTATFASPQGQAAWSYYLNLATKAKVGPPNIAGATASWDQINAPFIQGQVAMITSGDWSLGPIKTAAPNLNFGVAPLPKGKFPATVAGGYNLAVPTTASNSGAAFDFIKWMTAPAQNWILQAYFRLPATKSALKNRYDANHRAFLAQSNVAHAQPRIAQWSSVLYGPLADAWESVLLGQSDPTTALNTAQDKSNQLLKG